MPFKLPIVAGLLALLVGVTGCQRLVEISAGVRGIEAAELAARLGHGEPMTILHLRGPMTAEGHIPGALAVTADEAAGYLERSGAPRAQLLVTVSERGLRSLELANLARAQGYPLTRNLAGGMARWRELALPLAQGPPPAPETTLLALPLRLASRVEQSFTVISAFVVTPLLMILSLIIILRLRRCKEHGLALLKWGMVAFLAGEVAGAVNLASGIGDSGAAAAVLHGLALVLATASLAAGLFELVDRRVLKLGAQPDPEAHCALHQLCPRCCKRDPVACAPQRLGRLLAPTLAVIVLIPTSSPIAPLRFATPVFWSDMLTEYHWVAQLIELRAYPLAASTLFLLTGALLWAGPRSRYVARVLFALGLGLMTYALARCFLIHTFTFAPGWAIWWGQITKLAIVAVLSHLLILFGQKLGPPAGRRRAPVRSTGERLG